MLRIKRTSAPPDRSLLNEYAETELDEALPTWSQHASQNRMWDIWDDEAYVGRFGIAYGSYLGTGQCCWFMASKRLCDLTLQTWKRFRTILRRLRERLGPLTVYVREGFEVGCRFARFFGFRECGTVWGTRIFKL